MASAIDPTKPETGLATTASVRANFQAAKTEIEALQSGVIPSLPGVGLMLTFETIADMKAYDPLLRALLPTDALVRVGGYYTAGDGGGGTFRWADASTAPPNNGTIFAPDAGTGRWLRVVETPRNYDFLWFGAKSDAVTDDWDAIMATIDAAKAAGAGVEFSDGDYAVRQRVVINGSGINPEGTPAGELTAVHCFRGQGRQPFLSRFIALPGGTWPAGHAVVCGRNLAAKTVSNFAVNANGVADTAVDLAWLGTATGVPGTAAPSCSNEFTHIIGENARRLGINLDQAADCKVSSILYRGGTASIGISMQLGGGGIWADNLFCGTGRFRISSQNSGFVNCGAFSGLEISQEAFNHNYLGSWHIYPYTPKRTLPLNPFTTTNGSAVVTVTMISHGLVNGNFVELSGCVDTNGILEGELETTAATPRAITYMNEDQFSIVSDGVANATGAAGGSTVFVTGRGWTIWSSSPTGSGPRSLDMTSCYLNTLGVAGQKHFAGRWLNGARLNGCRIAQNLGTPAATDIYFDTAHWSLAGTDGTPPMFFFNNCGFSVDRPASIPGVALVGFHGVMQGTPVAANSVPLLEHPGAFHLPAALVDNPIQLGPLPTYLWADAQGHLRVRPIAGVPVLDTDGFRLVERNTGATSPIGAATPSMQGAIFVDTTNARVYLAYNTTNVAWLEPARLRTGTASPIGSQTPTRVGEIFVDTTTPGVYIANGLTNTSWATTPASLGTIATQNANAVTITGGSITGITDLAVADGGTGASTAGAARTNLGLGTIATQDAATVAITGGSVTGITDIAIADGGTGQSTAYAAKDALTIKGADMAAASTLDLATATGDYVEVTGNTTITALGTMAAGVRKTLRFQGTPTLTHNATSLIIPGGQNIVLSAGNLVEVMSLGSGNWTVVGYASAGFDASRLIAGAVADARLPTTMAGKTLTTATISSGTISGVDLQLRTFTVATLPSAATVGRIIYVSDGTGSNRVATSNGTNWVWVNTATVVS